MDMRIIIVAIVCDPPKIIIFCRRISFFEMFCGCSERKYLILTWEGRGGVILISTVIS